MTTFEEAQPDFHPNMNLVKCTDIGDIEELAGTMRLAAIKSGDISVSEEEAENYKKNADLDYVLSKAKNASENLLERGLLRILSFRGSKPVNVVLSLNDEDKNDKFLILSMSHGTTNGPQRLDDELTNVIVEAFFGYDDYKEVGPLAVFKKVRYFVKKV